MAQFQPVVGLSVVWGLLAPLVDSEAMEPMVGCTTYVGNLPTAMHMCLVCTQILTEGV